MLSRYLTRRWHRDLATFPLVRSRPRIAARKRRRSTILTAFEQLEERTLLAGIWLSNNAVMALPTTGPAWNFLSEAAQSGLALPNLHDQDEDVDVLTLAKAMAGVRLDDSSYLAQVRSTIMAAVSTESVDGVVTIANPFLVETTATFSAPGTYLLRLTADDGERHDEDQVTIRVYAAGASFTPTGEAALDGSGQVTITGTTSTENNDPDVYAGAQQVVSVNDVVTLRGTVTDDGLPTGNVSTIWEFVEPRTLALGRNLVSYVIAADLVELEPSQDVVFRNWLREVLTRQIDGRTLQSTQENRPNNWGTMAAASRAAAAVYLGDQSELDRTAQVLKGFLGDRSAYAGFVFESDNTWHIDPERPVGINPNGATKDGQNLDGSQPDEMRRGGSFQIPFARTDYPWESLQGAVVAAEILHRAGYDVWEWEDRALLRAVKFLYGMGWKPPKGHEWIPWIVDARYGTHFAENVKADPGKNMGWTSWTHQYGAPDQNRAPRLDAGPNQRVSADGLAILHAGFSDDGLPNPPASVSTRWSLVSGPAGATANFTDQTALITAVRLSRPGTYILQLEAHDGELTAIDELTITVLNHDEPITTSFQDGIDGYNGTRDTRLRGDFPTSNYGSSTKLELDGNPDQVSLIRWDTSKIPIDSTVTAASININVVNASIQDYEIYEALISWDEQTANFELAATGQPWEIPGAAGTTDHAPDVLAAVTSPITGMITVQLNAKGVALVQKWITDPLHNYGIVIQDLVNATTDDLDLSSREVIGLGPQLTVTYTLRSEALPSEPQFTVKHPPRLQLGNAPLGGFPGSETDQVEVLWETIPAGSGTADSFTVQYRQVGQTTWTNAGVVVTLVTGVEGRIIHSAVIKGLAYDQDYKYRVQHLSSGNPIATYQSNFRTRLPANSPAAFTFVAYGDSADLSSINGFRSVQNRINLIDPQLAILLGDNIYPEGTHEQSDVRFDPTISPEAVQWNASHIDYPTIGNHEIRLGSEGQPFEELFSVPIPVQGLNSSTQLPASERPEHNYSFDYGNVHFVSFDSNSEDEAVRLNAILTWAEQDLQASNAPWKIVFAHHPVAGVPDKPENPSDNYYKQVVPRLRAAGVDLIIVGHSHTYSRTYPLLGQVSGQATFVLDTDNNYLKGAGLVQVVSGVGGKEQRSGNYSQFPFVAAGFTGSTMPPAENGFAQIHVTPTRLTINYIAASDGEVLDSFAITGKAPNGPPLAANDSYNVTEDGILLVSSSQGVLFNDTDPNGDTLTATLVTAPSHGSLVLNDNGSFDYTPVGNYNGVDRFTYRATDGLTTSSDATAAIMVNPVNDPPVAENVVAKTLHNTSVSIALDGSDVDGDALSYSVVSGPSSGILQGTAPNLTYMPKFAFVGTDTFTYQVRDGSTSSAFAQATITVAGPVPVKASFRDGLNGYQGTRDTRFRGDQPTSTNGTSTRLELDGNPDQVSLIRWDTSYIPVGSTINSASLTVNVINTSIHEFEVYEALRPWDERTANYLVAATGQPWQLPGAAGTKDHAADVLATLSSPSTGVVTFNFNAKGLATIQKWITDPSRNHGIIIQDLKDQTTDDLDLSAREAAGLGPMLTVTYTLAPSLPPNNVPIANDQMVSTVEDAPASIALTGNDADNDPLSFIITSGPSNGTLAGTAPKLTYIPNSSFTGTDTFRYQVHDGIASSTAATVTINVMKSSNPVTLSFQNGVFPTVSYAGSRDTKIRGDQPTINQGTSGKLEMDGKPDIATLLRWDISQIPARSVVQSATITINVVNTSTHVFSLYRLLQPWMESGTTFNVFAAGMNWQIAGAQGPKDRDATVLGTVSAPALGTVTLQLNSAGVAVVQAWVNNATQNQGLTLQNYADASTDDLEFTSREGTTAQLRPKLTIAYKPPPSVSTSAIMISSLMTNPINPYDVNNDSEVTPSDALIVINHLNGAEGEENQNGRGAFPDVSGDKIVSPIDLLLVINYLNQPPTAEGEASSGIGRGFKPESPSSAALDALAVSGIFSEILPQFVPASFDMPRPANRSDDADAAARGNISQWEVASEVILSAVAQEFESFPRSNTDEVFSLDLEAVLDKISEIFV